MEGQLSGFPPGAKWRELVRLPEVVPEVTAVGLRAPTAPENEVCGPKFNFGETFDRDPFTEMCEVFKISQWEISERQKRQTNHRTGN